MAGLEVLQIRIEPAAAAIAFGIDKKDERYILLLDLGGSSLFVHVMEVDNGVFEYLAISHDAHLGGQDFDRCLADHFIDLFKERNPAVEIKDNKRAM